MCLFQVPLTLDQQRKIASVLNTFVYNSFIQISLQADKPLIKVATRCLHLLHERDSRHRFCPDALWLAPSRNDDIPIVAAARARDAAASMSENALLCATAVVITVPYVYPFEKRYTLTTLYLSCIAVLVPVQFNFLLSSLLLYRQNYIVPLLIKILQNEAYAVVSIHIKDIINLIRKGSWLIGVLWLNSLI